MTKILDAKIIGGALALGLGAWLSAQAASTGPTIASFSLPTGSYKAPLPDGYCLPTGKYDANAKLGAAADSTNLTDLTFYRCADMTAGADPTSWGMVKTPLSVVSAKAPPRSQLIAEMKSQVDPAAMKRLDDEAAKQATPQAERVFGQDLKVGMDAKAVGSDQFGIYFAGTLTVTDQSNKTTTLAIAYAITSANGGIFSIDIYGRYHNARDILNVLASVKKTTADFVNANGG